MSAAAYSANVGASVGWNTMLIDTISYILTLLGWLTYIVRTEPNVPPDFPTSASKDLASWNGVLNDLMKK
jgi:hypothetical protein